MKTLIGVLTLLGASSVMGATVTGTAHPAAGYERMAEWTFESRKAYADPFNEVEVDVIFDKDGKSWRVPAFWRGGQNWSVRFAPPLPGEYRYRLQSTDAANPDLNGPQGRVKITAYTGRSEVLKRGALRVSANKRYFEHSNGIPFYWLGDTWWSGLSDRLSWSGFQTLAADRKAKGFTVVHLVVGFVPPEEQAPIDPGSRNEGGYVWDAELQRINPQYFDAADRRIEHLLEAGVVPALVGGWRTVLPKMGLAKMKQHWRYIIARYGAYPAFLIAGGELYDPPPEQTVDEARSKPVPGWTELTRYIREIDPYHHPLSAHERPNPLDVPLRDPAVTDFDFIQPSHFGWNSVEAEVAVLNMRYGRSDATKPLVVAEIGYEKLGGTNFEDIQRAAFWLAMLNGAAGYSYGAAPTFEANDVDKPFQRSARFSLQTWEEGMSFPGSQQVGMSGTFLSKLDWWKFEPRPDWVTPRGTTLLDARGRVDIGSWLPWFFSDDDAYVTLDWPAGEWKARGGNARAPYAAGAALGSRVIYIPSSGLRAHFPLPTVLELPANRLYQVYFWDPVLGTRIDLGAIQYRGEGERVQQLDISASLDCESASPSDICIFKALAGQKDAIASLTAEANADASLILRYLDADNYLSAVYRAREKRLFLVERKSGVNSAPVATTVIGELGDNIRLSAEVRGAAAAISISDGRARYTSPIVDIDAGAGGRIGVLRPTGGRHGLRSLEVRRNSSMVRAGPDNQKLHDAMGRYRGQLGSPGWSDLTTGNLLLLDAYRPKRLPTLFQDWVLVLEHQPESKTHDKR